METGWKKEWCSARPKDAEVIGPTSAIIRRNIEPFEREGMDGETESGFVCECRIVPIAEYMAAIGEAGNDNALIGMGAQADLYEELAEQKENQMAIMMAIADLYEAQKTV